MQETLTKIYSDSWGKLETESEEQVLLNRLSQGDRTAFWQLWERYQNYLYHRCWTWMGGNSTDAEEAFSRSMLKAWKKLPAYAEKITNPKAWLTRISHNLCVDMHREGQRGARSIESIETIAGREDEAVISSSDSPESAVLRRELKKYIHHAVNALPSKLRKPFILRFEQEMSYPEIAKQLTLSQENVRKRIQQAREILQKQLNQYFSGLGDFSLDTPQSDELATANAQVTRECIVQSIDYRIIASCLETLPSTWYSLSNPLGWN
ncbi:MAG: RNA polymerase sigma factor [Microcystaceae cyanobacterium]